MKGIWKSNKMKQLLRNAVNTKTQVFWFSWYLGSSQSNWDLKEVEIVVLTLRGIILEVDWITVHWYPVLSLWKPYVPHTTSLNSDLQWYLIVVVFNISLITSDDKHFLAIFNWLACLCIINKEKIVRVLYLSWIPIIC